MHRYLVLLLLALLGSGCSSGLVPLSAATVQEAPTRTRCLTPRRVIVGIDATGSYERTAPAVAALADVIEASACPSDEWFLRWIREQSYSPDAAIQTVQFLPVPDRPASPDNPLDRREYRLEMRAWNDDAGRFTAQRRDAAAAVRGLASQVAGATDVFGFLVKADELLANAPGGSTPWILIASDMLHNAGPERPYQLRGANVLVLAYEAEDVVDGPRVRGSWEEALRAAGAAAVFWRDPTEPLVTDLDSLPREAGAGGKR